MSGQALWAAVRATVRASRPASGELKALLASRYAASDVLLTDSGTTALRLALEGALGERPGSTVAFPAYSCYDLATAAIGAGARVQLYDVDPHTLSPDLESLQRGIERGAGVVVVAHLFGIPVAVDAVQQICSRAGALLIEDAAQGAGGRWDNRLLGSFGSLSLLSFGRGKGTTGGGGGALLAHDEIGRGIVQRVSAGVGPGTHGRPLIGMAAQWILGRPLLYSLPASLPFLHLGETVYHEPWSPGGMHRASAAAVIRTIELSDREVVARRTTASRLLRVVGKTGNFVSVVGPARAEPGYLRLPILARDAARHALTRTGAQRLGIMQGYPVPLHRLEQFGRSLENPWQSLPGAVELAEGLFTFPTHARLTEADCKELERVLTLT